jgi:hypothetical protein
MSNNNNNSDRIYIILGVLGFLLVMSSCAALLIRHITKSDPSKKSSAPSPSPSPSSPDFFEYEFTVNHADNHSGYDAHIHFVELYDYNDKFIKRFTNNDIEIHKPPDHEANKSNYLGAWKSGSAPKDTKLFTIKSTKSAGKLHIMYGRPCYAPGWLIKENGKKIWEDTENGGPDLEPKHLIYSYDIDTGNREVFKIGNVPLIEIGSAVKCNKNDIRETGGVHRLVTPNQLNWYPNPEIADSWDLTWRTDTKEIEDCKGYTRGPNMEKNKLYYGGDSNLGRDGRNACNMTDDDKKHACDNDTELFGIGSGHTCGHKYYTTDKGQGSISSTDEYSEFYSCVEKDYV